MRCNMDQYCALHGLNGGLHWLVRGTGGLLRTALCIVSMAMPQRLACKTCTQPTTCTYALYL
jgi:hypothetical protein